VATGARATAAHFAAPAAFLLVVTIAVLLVRSSLHHTPSQPAPVTASSRVTTTQTTSGTGAGGRTVQAARYYSVRSGDTLGSIAYRFRTTVERLLALNPGIQPTALRIGQRVRVG
jgi:LysM repeat protein